MGSSSCPAFAPLCEAIEGLVPGGAHGAQKSCAITTPQSAVGTKGGTPPEEEVQTPQLSPLGLSIIDS